MGLSLLLSLACSSPSVPETKVSAPVAEKAADTAVPPAPIPETTPKPVAMKSAAPRPTRASRPMAQAAPAENLGVLGALRDQENTQNGLEGINGVLGSSGTQGGSGSLGGRGTGMGGAGVGDGVAGGFGRGGGTMGTKGRGTTEMAERKVATAPLQKKQDWGGTTYLSNDDSLSVASAQRLIWAVKRGAAVSPSEVRPHELLNYFTFATNSPASGELFAVRASAHRDGDHMSLALAVHGASKSRRPLDLTLVVDRSGSMTGEGRMEYLKKALHRMERQLKAGDRVDLVSFDDRAEVVLQDFVVGGDTGALSQAIDQLRPRGSTNLNAGLQEGYRLARLHPASSARNRQVLLITDAELNAGVVNQDMVSQVGKAFEEDGIHLTGVGVGTTFNDQMLNKLTEKGRGAYVYLGSESVIERFFGAGFNTLVEVLAEDVQFSLKLPPSLATERFYGEESSRVASEVQKVNFNAGATQVFLQDLKMANPQDSDPLALTIRYQLPGKSEKASWTWNSTLGEILAGSTVNADKAKALMNWSDLVLAQNGQGDCGAALEAWQAHPEESELNWLEGISRHLCEGSRSPASVAEME